MVTFVKEADTDPVLNIKVVNKINNEINTK